MKTVASTITAVQIEGNLIAPDMTSLVLTGSIKGQTPEDFGFAKTDKLADEIATAWGDAKAYWTAFQRALLRLDADDPATTITREWSVPLLRSLGYDPIYTAKAEVVEGQTYAISHRAEPGENKPPIHIIGCRVKVDQRPPSGTPRLSAHALVQEYLNKTEHLWAIATNGLRWRLLRDSSLMTRLTYIEFDLEQILNGENFAEFGLFYRLFHRSRLPQGMDDADKCLLEYYHQEALQQGGRVRDRLRDGVEKALIQLGTGFLQHPHNEHLRQKLTVSKKLTEVAYYRQLLRLIYRLLFLMVAESRNLLLIGEDIEKARIYREYYSSERLRELAERPSWQREGFQDLWQGLRVTFLLFDENWRGKLLGLSPLNGDLFGSGTLPDLGDCAIDNYDLLLAIRYLSLYQDKGQLRRVNYGALDNEELGSIYESLLDFHPQVIQRQGIYQFVLVFGSDRKTTGSYYTPPQLVQQLIKTALEPVIAEKIRDLKSPHELEKALLSLKVVDPACGSGHFLLAAARRIGKELAKIRTGEAEPGQEPLRAAIRDVIQNCIYGVDLNPLAVDLCKVALWIEGFSRRLPLNFLDHRIKCGNSLVGVMDLRCLDGGIPDEAFKAVTGDDKQLSTQFKKRNKQERNNQGQLSLGDLESDRAQYGEGWRELGEIAETTPKQVKHKEQQYKDTLENAGWKRDYWACNLWTAAFFMPLTQDNLQLLPTTAALNQLLRGNLSTQNIVDAANKLAQEKHFFHWALEFPEVFEADGFDCVLGNPPWERIKLQEKEFFASRSLEIVNAANKAAREKLIKELPKINLDLAQAFEEAKHDAEAQSKFIRESVRFPLTAVGDINTYAVFAETMRKLISPNGRLGVIVPTGIATDDTCKKFFGDLIQNQALVSLYDFENREKLFAAIDSRMKFSLLAISGQAIAQGNFAFFLTQQKQLDNPARLFKLSPQDIALLNPNTLTCPVFRTRTDAEITKKIYQRVPVLENERTGSNPWGISFMRMFDMSNDSGLFRNEAGKNLVPLYEAKMFHQFDHRWATYSDRGDIRDSTDVEKCDSSFQVKPRYWVNRNEVENKLGDRWEKSWLLNFRDVTNSTNERTSIFSLLPKVAVNHKAPLLFTSQTKPEFYCLLIANLNSLVLDYVTRQKIGGTSLSFFILKQLPVIPPEVYTPENIEFISSRVLELVYTAWDMQPFAQDMGYDGEPFIWNPNRRALLRSELDAYYAKLYGLTRDELRYILDPADVYGADFPSKTFRVLKNNEIKQFGEYRTQRLVLEAWDKMFT
ncbi:Eco57I restriction-modification methylase domain-containing protein [Gloeocapsopsis dulcis]|uniref:site-specific DNA-methyltransferase (adenine-specific) n=1 Tax=Gloeocapsopsis dulcis AAB1 = 1H9 TaxID=1433147 RepID=A0A6N8FSX2_9CHRO|nr:N-6 DNA methylase [Gloeocapsopsis dulcis]MUL36230.1 restriction endonuclease [Gloeocapsopsis dulcis AAB1 = 1H9]WNN89655.1 N-6 DNA methylase [Gloeocapsopsis dulcis]